MLITPYQSAVIYSWTFFFFFLIVSLPFKYSAVDKHVFEKKNWTRYARCALQEFNLMVRVYAPPTCFYLSRDKNDFILACLRDCKTPLWDLIRSQEAKISRADFTPDQSDSGGSWSTDQTVRSRVFWSTAHIFLRKKSSTKQRHLFSHPKTFSKPTFVSSSLHPMQTTNDARQLWNLDYARKHAELLFANCDQCSKILFVGGSVLVANLRPCYSVKSWRQAWYNVHIRNHSWGTVLFARCLHLSSLAPY